MLLLIIFYPPFLESMKTEDKYNFLLKLLYFSSIYHIIIYNNRRYNNSNYYIYLSKKLVREFVGLAIYKFLLFYIIFLHFCFVNIFFNFFIYHTFPPNIKVILDLSENVSEFILVFQRNIESKFDLLYFLI